MKGYYILFKDCAAHHGPGWESSRGQSGFDLAKLVCNGSIVLLHYFTDPCSYLYWSITNTHDMIHKCDTPQWIHVLFFFQLKAFTFLWHTGKNSLLTTNLLSHTHSSSLSQAVVTVWSSQCSRIHSYFYYYRLLLQIVFPPSANYTRAMTWSIQYQLFASFLPHTSWLQCTGG